MRIFSSDTFDFRVCFEWMNEEKKTEDESGSIYSFSGV